MNKIKINVDRPKIKSEEIRQKMNFEQILANHKLMTKPFYKSYWFYGTVGLASVSVIAIALSNKEIQAKNTQQVINAAVTNSVPIPSKKKINVTAPKKNKQEKEKIINNKKLPIEKKSTLNIDKSTNQKPEFVSDFDNKENEVKENLTIIENNKVIESKNDKTFNFFDFHPRISGKINGAISKKELFDNKGITTNTDVKVIHFELHLVDGYGGKIFVGDGNQLTKEMKTAIAQIGTGNEIYFEDIYGLTNNNKKVRLSPLRYTLLN